MLDVFITPTSVWRPIPPTAADAKNITQAAVAESWEDAATDRRWRDALLLFLMANRWDKPRLWQTINQIVFYAFPRSRMEVREATVEVLKAVRDLTREGRIRRVRKKWLTPVVVPSPHANMAKVLRLPEPNV